MDVDQRRESLRVVLVEGAVTPGAPGEASKEAFRLGHLLGGSRRGGVRRRTARDGSFGPVSTPLDEKRKQQIRALKTHRFFSRVADRGTGGSASFSAAVVVEVSAGARLALDASDLSVNSSG